MQSLAGGVHGEEHVGQIADLNPLDRIDHAREIGDAFHGARGDDPLRVLVECDHADDVAFVEHLHRLHGPFDRQVDLLDLVIGHIPPHARRPVDQQHDGQARVGTCLGWVRPHGQNLVQRCAFIPAGGVAPGAAGHHEAVAVAHVFAQRGHQGRTQCLRGGIGHHDGVEFSKRRGLEVRRTDRGDVQTGRRQRALDPRRHGVANEQNRSRGLHPGGGFGHVVGPPHVGVLQQLRPQAMKAVGQAGEIRDECLSTRTKLDLGVAEQPARAPQPQSRAGEAARHDRDLRLGRRAPAHRMGHVETVDGQVGAGLARHRHRGDGDAPDDRRVDCRVEIARRWVAVGDEHDPALTVRRHQGQGRRKALRQVRRVGRHRRRERRGLLQPIG